MRLAYFHRPGTYLHQISAQPNNPSRQFVKSHVVLLTNQKDYILFKKTQQGWLCWAHYKIRLTMRESQPAVPARCDAPAEPWFWHGWSRREPQLGRLSLIYTSLPKHFPYCRSNQMCVWLSSTGPVHIFIIFPPSPIINNPSRQFEKSHVVLLTNQKDYMLFK